MELLLNVISLFAIVLGTIFCCSALLQMFRAGGFKIVTAVDVVRVLKARDLYKFAFAATFLVGYIIPFMNKFMEQFADDTKPISLTNPIDLPFGIPRAVNAVVILLHIPVGLWLLYLWKEGFFDLIKQHTDLLNNFDKKEGERYDHESEI